MVRLRDSAVILVPQKRTDSNTGRKLIDWDLEPTEHPTPFQGQELETGGSLDEETTLAQRRGFLPASMSDVVTAACRITWEGRTYSIDGPVVRKRKASRVRYLVVNLKPVAK